MEGSSFYYWQSVVWQPDVVQIFVNVFVEKILWDVTDAVGLEVHVLQLAEAVQRSLAYVLLNIINKFIYIIWGNIITY